jgi:mannose/fructose/N-acetylgalactosamine-specific phosphotransferase system component IID
MNDFKKNIILTSILLVLFIIGFFLPVLDFSFGVTLNGFEAFVMQGVSVLSSTTYSEYLWKAFLLITPILDVVLIFWLLRKQINRIAIIIVGMLVLIGAASWIFRYGSLGILRIGYYYWLALNIALVAVNFIAHREKKTNNP